MVSPNEINEPVDYKDCRVSLCIRPGCRSVVSISREAAQSHLELNRAFRILECIHVAFSVHAIYHYVIINYANPAVLIEVNWWVFTYR